eukprot:scaffold191894_cov45-Attheya_sp.AAC.1
MAFLGAHARAHEQSAQDKDKTIAEGLESNSNLSMDNPDYINFPGEQRLLSVKKANKSKSSKSAPTVPVPPSPEVTPFTDTGGTFTLQQAVDAFLQTGRIGLAVKSTGT